jgi:hypothetical protein
MDQGVERAMVATHHCGRCGWQVVIQSLIHKDLVANRSFDIVSKEAGAGIPTKDWPALFKKLPAP